MKIFIKHSQCLIIWLNIVLSYKIVFTEFSVDCTWIFLTIIISFLLCSSFTHSVDVRLDLIRSIRFSWKSLVLNCLKDPFRSSANFLRFAIANIQAKLLSWLTWSACRDSYGCTLQTGNLLRDEYLVIVVVYGDALTVPALSATANHDDNSCIIQGWQKKSLRSIQIRIWTILQD